MTPLDERRTRVLKRFAEGQSSQRAGWLCAMAAEVVAVSGAGVMLMSGDVSAGRACASDGVAAAIEDLQFKLGEGPCSEAYLQGHPVLVPDLTAPELGRWPAFASAALEAGACAVFGFPLQIGAVRLGALSLYRAEAGPLTLGQHVDALTSADVIARMLLAMQAEAPPGSIAAEIEAGGDLHLVVHQASGMVASQLEVSVAEAMIRLRAFAFANDRGLPEVARDVVGRRLRFDDATTY